VNQEHKNEEPREAGLTIAALAAGEPTASKTDLDPRAWEIESKRKDVRAGVASTMDGNGVAATGAATALATDEQAASLF
jgi:hypothetical protein